MLYVGFCILETIPASIYTLILNSAVTLKGNTFTCIIGIRGSTTMLY